MSDPQVRATHAKQLLDDSLLVEVLDTIEQAAITAWRSTAMAATDDRERVWHTLKAAERVRSVLQGIVDNGQIEARKAMTPR